MNENEAETIGEFIGRIMKEKKLSSYDVAERSGNRINQSYLIKIRKGRVANPSPEKLQIIAKGLGITEEEIFAVARGKLPSSNLMAREKVESLILRFEKLPTSKKIYAQALIDLLNREFDRLLEEN